jgi:hypothetical protein
MTIRPGESNRLSVPAGGMGSTGDFVTRSCGSATSLPMRSPLSASTTTIVTPRARCISSSATLLAPTSRLHQEIGRGLPITLRQHADSGDAMFISSTGQNAWSRTQLDRSWMASVYKKGNSYVLRL